MREIGAIGLAPLMGAEAELAYRHSDYSIQFRGLITSLGTSFKGKPAARWKGCWSRR